MPSPELLGALPEAERLRDLTRALAVLDAVLEQQWDLRVFSFDAAWGEKEQMGSMRNGSGDDWFCWFGSVGVAIVGFDHESPMSPHARQPPSLWPGLLDDVPAVFLADVLEEPAFSIEDSTFVIWREAGDRAWHASEVDAPCSTDPDGAQGLLEPLIHDDPSWYVAFASDYHEVDVDPAAVASIYAGEPLTSSMVSALGAARAPDAALHEAAEMGYPTA